MPTGPEPGFAVDSSVAVAALDPSHEFHLPCRQICTSTRPALAGHAAFETFSVLTRLPGPSRVDPVTATRLLQLAFPERCWLSGRHQLTLSARLGELGLVGGMVYDALVAEAARVAGRVLLTRDERARRTYARLGVGVQFVD